MSWAEILVSLGEFALSVALVIGVLYTSFWLFVRRRERFDKLAALKAGNVAVGIWVSAVMIGPGIIVSKTIAPAMFFLRIVILGGADDVSLPAATGIALLHVLFAYAMAMATTWLALIVFDRLTREIEEREEIEHGNVAVALVMAGVVVVVTVFMIGAIGALSKALLPELGFGQVQVFGG